ncbi:MAG: DUF624 domain-containing protein [Erysipelotrichaceae bacterium]|nr:DUF624 domain-containing protein [Erysipelotrichaceae bacterium]
MKYNSPFIKMLEAAANMLIVTFLWFVFALPVVTLVSSSAALYHTTCKVIFGPKKGNGVFADFFASYKENLIPGIKLTLIVIVACLFVAEGLWTGYQIYRLNIWGMLYLILGIVISSIIIGTIVYIPPVLSRFVAPVFSIVRLAVYFAMKKPLRSLVYLLVLGFMVLMIDYFPLFIMILPAVYADLVRTYLEKDLNTFIQENDLAEITVEEKEEEIEEETEESAFDLEEKLSEKKDGDRK